MPSVSVIIPVHNSEQFLVKCVASVTSQTLSDIEIILVENGSSDKSPALCDKLGEMDQRIKVMHIGIGDLSYARNEGVKIAHADYVSFIDSDDTIEPEMLESMYTFAMKESLDIVFCDFVKCYDYRSNRYSSPRAGEVWACSAKELLEANLRDEITQSACTMICKKSLFDNVAFPRKRYYEDLATTWKLILAAKRGGHIGKPYYHYYRHGGSIVHTAKFAIPYGHVMADMERIDYINSQDCYTQAEKFELGAKSLTFFYRHFNKMVKLAKTQEEKDICLKCRDWALNLPKGYIIRRKYDHIRKMVRNHWKIFCFLRRGSFI